MIPFGNGGNRFAAKQEIDEAQRGELCRVYINIRKADTLKIGAWIKPGYNDPVPCIRTFVHFVDGIANRVGVVLVKGPDIAKTPVAWVDSRMDVVATTGKNLQKITAENAAKPDENCIGLEITDAVCDKRIGAEIAGDVAGLILSVGYFAQAKALGKEKQVSSQQRNQAARTKPAAGKT